MAPARFATLPGLLLIAFSLSAAPARMLVAQSNQSTVAPAAAVAPVNNSPVVNSAAVNKPVISKVDPPNWWIGLPAPMLLIHGEHLDAARLTASAPGVRIVRQQVSPNGHWAFLWLSTASARPGAVRIAAANRAGSAAFSFPLLARQSGQGRYQGFSSRDVMYLIMPDRFADGDLANDRLPDAPKAFDPAAPRAYHGGDLAGIEKHLDYLQGLGVTTLWTTPLYDNAHNDPSSYHGYGATDMYAVNEHLGTLAQYQHLVASAHNRGLKVVLDTVPNHVGPQHPWVLDPPTPNWFHGTLADHLEARSPFGPITDPHAAFLQYRDTVQGWFANVLPDLNQEDPLVSQYLIQNAVWWIESAGLDGLRLDTFPYVGRAFWHRFHAELHHLYPHLTTVGEVFNPDPTIASYFAGGIAHAGTDGTIDSGLDTPFDFPVFFALRGIIAHDEPMTRLQDTLRQDWLYPHPERLVTFIGNHDTRRFLSEPGATSAILQLALGLLATLRGMPQLYSGDEIAMTGGDDPDNRRDFPGGFPNSTHDAFIAAGRTQEEAAVYDSAAALFQLRDHHPALQAGAQFNIFCDDKTFAFVRIAPGNTTRNHLQPSGETLLVVANNSDQAKDLTLQLNYTALQNATTFTGVYNNSSTIRATNHRLTLSLAPRQLLILQAH